VTRNTPWIAGLNFSHNGSVCLLKGDKIVAAVQEERLTRVKRSCLTGGLLGSKALAYCLNIAGIGVEHVDLFVSVGKENQSINVVSNNVPLIIIPHYLAHAYAGYAISGFKDAIILVVDGLGESLPSLRDNWPEELSGAYYADFPKSEKGEISQEKTGEIIGIYHASGTKIELLEKHIGGWLVPGGIMPCFGSLGAMYSSVAKLIFGEALDAGKVMGLAPYGTTKYPAKDFLTIDSNNTLRFSDHIPNIFNQYQNGWPNHRKLFQDLSCSTQNALEKALFYFFRRCRDLSVSNNFVYSGGVALNSVANEKMIRKRSFKNHYIIPAAEDSGLAIGAAYFGLWRLKRTQSAKRLDTDSLGKTYSINDIEHAVTKMPNTSVRYSGQMLDTVDSAVEYLLNKKIIGIFNGRSEFGPRALGHRSILCDPRRTDAKEVLNARVKNRESFRPFAPMVLLEEVGNWFNIVDEEPESPFMLRVYDFKEDVKHLVPAVVHVDGTGRVQTVSKQSNGITYSCLKKFYDRTGVPVLLNTSFNRMNEPIVETPEDALWCLLFSDLDAVVFEWGIVTKDPAFKSLLDYRPMVMVDLESMQCLTSKTGDPAYVHPTQCIGGSDPFYIRGDTAVILSLCCNTGSGWELLEKVSHVYGDSDSWNELRVLNALGVLKSCGLIDFKDFE
jgi:carbamoyltransferase